ncbi:hypothetical protein Q3G72_027623 [Acer saccharum]|nr:hypothetical protein Q3G72_027623 [Acer saccharum]
MVLVELVAGCQASKIPVELKPRLKGIISKLEKIAEHKDVLGLKESFGGKHYQRLPTTSLVDECKSGELHGISEKTRHFSSARDRVCVVQKFDAWTEAKFLRTFLLLGPSSKSSSGSNYVNSSIFEMVLPKLSCLRALSLPYWNTPNLTSLGKLEISSCPKLESFPNGGWPSNLKTLLIEKCDRLTGRNGWGLNNMTFLTRLTIKGGCSKLNSFPTEGLLPASLKYIQISEFPVLKTLDLKGLQRLALLKELQIDLCDALQCYSDDGTDILV